MTVRRSILLQLLALGLAVAMSFCALPFLKGPVPIHWGISGRPDAWGSPLFALLLGPTLLVGAVAGSLALVRRLDQGTRDGLAGMAVVAAFFLVEHGLTLGATALGAFFPLRPLLAVVFGLFVGLAPVMARVEQNPWFGVRTPWTLGSRRVWKATHRATARLWIVGGLFGAVLAFFAPLLITLAYLLVLALAPVGMSYRIWTKLGRP